MRSLDDWTITKITGFTLKVTKSLRFSLKFQNTAGAEQVHKKGLFFPPGTSSQITRLPQQKKKKNVNDAVQLYLQVAMVTHVHEASWMAPAARGGGRGDGTEWESEIA